MGKTIDKYNEKIKRFNDLYAYKYGEIFINNETEEDQQIQKDIEFIRTKINNYYNARKVSQITPCGVINEEWENINPDKSYNHPYINVYCTGSLKSNAIAAKIDDEYYIGILKGLLVFFKERISDFVEDESFSNILEIGMVIPWRMKEILYQRCLEFLSFHEFFHITNGHCDLMKKLDINELCEANSKDDVQMSLLNQTLEYDADCCAIASLINEELRMYIMIQQNLNMSNSDNWIDSIVKHISGTLIGLYILYNLLHESSYKNVIMDEISLKKKGHPVPGLRIFYIMINSFDVVRKSNFFTSEELDIIIERTLKSWGSFIKEFDTVINPEFIKIIKTEIGMNHLQQIHNNWKDVREMIDTHYARLAPYGEFDYGQFIMREE